MIDDVEIEYTTTGPIVACDNAIEHYTTELERVTETKRSLERKLDEANAQQSLFDDMREQWRAARQVLIAAARNT
jgi:hypothetical protein